MKQIPLTQGQVAIVDDEDFERINQYKWCAHWFPGIQTYYAVRNYYIAPGKTRTEYMHRHILQLSYKDGNYVDHKNHNGLDNRKENIIVTTCRKNNENRKDVSKFGSGIRFDKRNKTKPYQAHAMINGKWCHIGMFANVEEAKMAREKFIEDKDEVCESPPT